MCGVEIDPLSYQVRVDRYVSMHDAGRILNPMIATGQIRGAFAQGVAAALYEEFSYNEEGAFLRHFRRLSGADRERNPAGRDFALESPSPLTPLGAKGLAEGNCMSTPVCIANAIADALGVADVALPATPRRIHAMMEAEKHVIFSERSGALRGGVRCARVATRKTSMKKINETAPFDYARPDTVEEAIALLGEYGDEARVLAGGQSLLPMLNLRLIDLRGADRHFAHRGARCHLRPRRQDRNRRRGDAEQALGVAGASDESCRWLPPRCLMSAISRPAIAARSAARSRMPIRARNCRWRWPCSAAKWYCARRAAAAYCRQVNSRRIC